MERKLEDITSEALQMSGEPVAEEYERLWVEEAARRYQQLKSGSATSIASDELFARLDARSRR
jgi:hypothetical protein